MFCPDDEKTLDRETLLKLTVAVTRSDKTKTEIRCGSFERFKKAMWDHHDVPIKNRARGVESHFGGVPVKEDWRVPENLVILLKEDGSLVCMRLPDA